LIQLAANTESANLETSSENQVWFADGISKYLGECVHPPSDRGALALAMQRKGLRLVEFAFGRAGLGGNDSRGDNHTDECEADHEFVH
jgi:hypothetical protein